MSAEFSGNDPSLLSAAGMQSYSQLIAGGVEKDAAFKIAEKQFGLRKTSRASATTEAAQAVKPVQAKPEVIRARSALAPVRHPEIELFCCVGDVGTRNDLASMEAPIFSLSSRKDMKIWRWASKDGSKTVEIAPSAYGRATQLDKDVLIFCVSHLVQALNESRPVSRTIRFKAKEYFQATNRRTDGDEYARFIESLKRLSGTRLTTSIVTNGTRIREGFGLIEKWTTIETESGKMASVEITLSEWFYNSVLAFEVLAMPKSYFRLRKPLERRLFELAAKHLGKQERFKISLAVLAEKTGSTCARLADFRRAIATIVRDDETPNFSFSIDSDDNVVIRRRNGE